MPDGDMILLPHGVSARMLEPLIVDRLIRTDADVAAGSFVTFAGLTVGVALHPGHAGDMVMVRIRGTAPVLCVDMPPGADYAAARRAVEDYVKATRPQPQPAIVEPRRRVISGD